MFDILTFDFKSLIKEFSYYVTDGLYNGIPQDGHISSELTLVKDNNWFFLKDIANLGLNTDINNTIANTLCGLNCRSTYLSSDTVVIALNGACTRTILNNEETYQLMNKVYGSNWPSFS